MVKFSVCLETVFIDLPVEERIRRIRDAGYDRVEFWHPEGTWDGQTVRTDLAKDAGALRRACEAAGVTLNDFAFHAWDGSIGGSPVRPEDRGRFLEQVRKMLAFAKEAGCRSGIVLSGTADPALSGSADPAASRSRMRASLEEALAGACALAEEADVTLLLEPLNTLVDHAGYWLDGSREAAEIIDAVGSPRLKLLYDVYHMQVMEGNLIATIERLIGKIGHFHSAGVPGRGELFGSEIDYPVIIRRLEALGYEGTFGLEYFPRLADHGESLRRTLGYLQGTVPISARRH